MRLLGGFPFRGLRIREEICAFMLHAFQPRASVRTALFNISHSDTHIFKNGFLKNDGDESALSLNSGGLYLGY